MAATHDHILSFCVQQKHFILLFFCPLHWSSSRPGFFLFCFFCLSSSSSSASFIFWAGLHKQLQKHQGLACIICVEFLFRAASVWEQPFGERPQLWIMGWDWGLVLFELSFSNKPKPFKLFFNFFFFYEELGWHWMIHMYVRNRSSTLPLDFPRIFLLVFSQDFLEHIQQRLSC